MEHIWIFNVFNVSNSEPLLELLGRYCTVREFDLASAGIVNPAKLSQAAYEQRFLLTGTSRTTAPLQTFDFQFDEGEQLLWQGVPKVTLRLRKTDLITIPIILYFSFFASLVVSLWLGLIPSSLSALGIVFICVAAVALLVMAQLEVHALSSFRYALTDRRVISIQKQGSGMVLTKSIEFRHIDTVCCQTYADETGVIVFNIKEGIMNKLFGPESVCLDPSTLAGPNPLRIDVADARKLVKRIERQVALAKA